MLTERGSLIAMLVLLVVFALGAERMLEWRYQQGDVYPPYSSLRADPLGAKGYYEGLDGLRGVELSRIFNATEKLGAGKGCALFVLGASNYQLRKVAPSEADDLQLFLAGGGRAVFTLYPEGRALSWTGAERTMSRKKNATNDLDAEFRPVSLEDQFGFRLEASPLLADDDRIRAEPVTVVDTSSGLPRLMSWHSAIYFDQLDEAWTTIYARRGKAVLIERAVGAGSLVLASDSYFASNEALRRERQPELLAWLTGGRRNIMFDETHLGVERRPGVAALARQYHLTGLAAGLALVAALFIWRDTASFLPPVPDPVAQNGLVEGRDSAAGLGSLLRRGVGPSDLLTVCLAEWKRTGAAPEKAAAVERIIAAENARPARQRSPVSAYRAIQRLLAKRA